VICQPPERSVQFAAISGPQILRMSKLTVARFMDNRCAVDWAQADLRCREWREEGDNGSRADLEPLRVPGQ
jgi:hypothetical protein